MLFDVSFWSLLLYGAVGAVAYSFAVDYFITPRPKLSDYKNKHVIITGGSAGLGKSLAIKLAKLGANITILARDIKKLESAKKQIEDARSSTSQKVHIISADAASYQDIDKAIKEAVNVNGPVDVAVANAGFSYPCYFLEAPIEKLESETKVNYLGYLYFTKAVLPHMVQRNKGHIVLVSSAIVFTPMGGYTNYGATKCAVKGFADGLRNELNMYNIGVTVYCPAGINTDGFQEENKTKPKETIEIEGSSTTLTADQCADVLINGLKKGEYCIVTEFVPLALVRSLTTSLFTPRSSVLLDAVTSFVLILVSPFLLMNADGIWRKAKRPTEKKRD